MTTKLATVAPLLVAILNRDHLSKMTIDLIRYYYQCIYFFPSPKATSLM